MAAYLRKQRWVRRDEWTDQAPAPSFRFQDVRFRQPGGSSVSPHAWLIGTKAESGRYGYGVNTWASFLPTVPRALCCRRETQTKDATHRRRAFAVMGQSPIVSSGVLLQDCYGGLWCWYSRLPMITRHLLQTGHLRQLRPPQRSHRRKPCWW